MPSGQYDVAIHTDDGPKFFQNAVESIRESDDPQLVGSYPRGTMDVGSALDNSTTDQLLQQLTDAGADPPGDLLCLVELTQFDTAQRQTLLPLLWQFILRHRDSNHRNELVAVGAAIRKYIAIMPMDRMGELADLLESGHRSPLPIELEIEVAKMIYRNFEVHPPEVADPHPKLAERLLEIVRAYTHPRILVRDKHSAAASLAIESIIAMRSQLAIDAWQAATSCPYRWFAELVSDDLDELHKRWAVKSPAAADWLDELRAQVMAVA